MSRRRRLALREIAQPEEVIVLSDVEDDSHGASAAMAEPNFSLLPTLNDLNTTGSAAHPQTIDLEDDGIDDDALSSRQEDQDQQQPTQPMSSQSQREGDCAAAKRPRIQNDHQRSSTTAGSPPSPPAPVMNKTAKTTTPASEKFSGVFQLYQTGLCADHTLQLHFIRRRPPPPPPKRIEQEFVLPRPPLTLLDMVPPLTLRLSDILGQQEADVVMQEPPQNSMEQLQAILTSAKSHWRNMETAPTATKLTWRALEECDWHQVFEHSGSFVPSTKDLLDLLQTLRSDALACFVWTSMVVAVLTQIHSSTTQASLVPSFAAALLSHVTFRRLPAKTFREQLRAKQLRAIDELFGAEAELILVKAFHKSRNGGNLYIL